MAGRYPAFAAGDHKALMQFAAQQARLAPPSPPKLCVGAVLVDGDTGEILSAAFSEELPGDRPGDPGNTHAEHGCFIKVADQTGLHDTEIGSVLPPNTVLYTTLEPCSERRGGNRTCVGRILGLGDAIKTVYVGLCKPGTVNEATGGIERLHEAGIEVVLMDDDRDLRRLVVDVTFAGHDHRADVEG